MAFIVWLIGLCVGSFANVLIDRLPKGEDVLMGRSQCDYCKKILRWFELIPVLSFLWQRGRCVRCHKSLSFQYPLIELLASGISVFLFFRYGSSSLYFIGSCLIALSFLVMFFADIKYYILPDSMLVVALTGILLVAISNFQFPIFSLFSALGASLFFFSLWVITRGRGMGFGDVKLAFVLGLLTGFPGIVITLYIAFLTGAFVGVILILQRKKSMGSRVPFGPFLLLGAVITVLFQSWLLHFWMNIWNF